MAAENVRRFPCKTFCQGIILAAILYGGLWAFFIRPAQHAVKASVCHAHLFKIGHALREYDSIHGALPPAFVAGADGKPAHSWRTLITAHLGIWGEEVETFSAKYDFEQPWNGPENSELLVPVEEIRYACPCGWEHGTTRTNYVVLTGANTLFPGSSAAKLSEIPEGQDTIVVVEVTNSNIEWTEPRDLSIDAIESPSEHNALQLVGVHEGSFRYVTASGKFGTLPASTSLDEIRRRAEVERR